MIGRTEYPAVLSWVRRASWEGAVLALLVVGVQLLLRKKLPAHWSFALWWLVIVRLVLPATIPTRWSPFNLFSRPPVSASVVPSPPSVAYNPGESPSHISHLNVPDPGLIDRALPSISTRISTSRLFFRILGIG